MDNDNCCICLEQLEVNQDNIIQQNCCNRKFHKDCLKTWFSFHPTCPLCRSRENNWSTEEINLYNILVYIRTKYRDLDLDSTLVRFSEFLNYVINEMSECNFRNKESFEKNLKMFDDIIKIVRMLFNTT